MSNFAFSLDSYRKFSGSLRCLLLLSVGLTFWCDAEVRGEV